MDLYLFFTAVMFFTNCANSQSAPAYVISAPKQVRPLSTYTIFASLHNANSAMNIKATISSNTGQSVIGQASISPGASAEIKLQIGDWSGVGMLLVQGIGAISFNRSQSLNFNSKKCSVFIQTDKAIYQASQKAQFRVFVIDSELKPYASKVTIYITDPQGNRIKQYLNATLEKGVFSDELQLSDQPLLGNWEIKATVESIEKIKLISVEEYVLPTFEVTITAPPVALFTETATPIRVEAKYTFGKPVQGAVMVYVSDTCYEQRQSPECFSRPNISATLDKKGQVVIQLDVSKIRYPESVYNYGSTLKLLAVVTEDLTGNTMNDTGIMKIYRYREKLTITSSPDTFRSGLPLYVKATLSDQENKPILNSDAPVNFNITYRNNMQTITENKFAAVPANGMVTIQLKPLAPTTVVTAQASYKTIISNNLYIQLEPTLGNNYILIELSSTKKSLKAGDIAVFTIYTTFSISQLLYEVVSGGEIVDSRMVQFQATNQYKLSINTTHDMAPQSDIIVYVVTSKNELISDRIDFYVDGFFRTPVKLSVNPNETQPGGSVVVEVDTNPSAMVYCLGLDQSVLLLKSGNDITKEEVENDFAKYDGINTPVVNGDVFFRFPPIMDAPRTFLDAGIILITNAAYYTPPPPIWTTMAFRGPMLLRPTNSIDGGALNVNSGNILPQQPSDAGLNIPPPHPSDAGLKTRKLFPESWIWTILSAGNDGKAILNVTAPDSITSWIISAIAMDSNTGIGIGDSTAKVTVFKPFFVSLNLPYSIVRGEILNLQALVFNYLKERVQANVTLFNENGDFEFADEPKNAISQTKIVTIPAGETISAVFPIISKIVGYVKIKVSAIAVSPIAAGDAIQKDLLTKAEGTTRYFNRAVLIDLRQTNSFSLSVEIIVPNDVVSDSKRVQIAVMGDIMGPTLTNIDSLLRVPYGCGEQNMIYFVPNIVVGDYLSTIGELTAERKAKAVSNIALGYQRELTYKHKDGSYSAFGDRDPKGSTWLTAYVLRSFFQAKTYIAISDAILNEGLKFLATTQNTLGIFIEYGNVIHKDLQGGSTTSGLSMTAYICTTFFIIKNPSYNQVVTACIRVLEERLPKAIDPYEVAIITYALHLGGSTMKDTAFTKLQGLATKEGEYIYWKKLTNGTQTAVTTSYETDSTNSLDVEATGHSLLTYALRSQYSDAIGIVRWMVSKRNEFGAFASTQDTVIGLEALSKIAQSKGIVNIDCKYNGAAKSFTVTKENALVLQQETLPPETQAIQIAATGNGSAVVQVTWSYNIPTITYLGTFAITATIDSQNSYSYKLTVCATYIASYGESSNMAIIELNALSGYTFDTQYGPVGANRVDYELGDTRLNLYYYKIDSTKTCATATATKNNDVYNLKEAEVKVYDYYQPGNKAKTGYLITSMS